MCVSVCVWEKGREMSFAGDVTLSLPACAIEPSAVTEMS